MFGFGNKKTAPIASQGIGPQFQIITMKDDLDNPLIDESQLQQQLQLSTDEPSMQDVSDETKVSNSPFLTVTPQAGSGQPTPATGTIPVTTSPKTAQPQSISLAPDQSESIQIKTQTPIVQPQQIPAASQLSENIKTTAERPSQPIMREPGLRPIQSPSNANTTPTLEKIIAAHDTYPIKTPSATAVETAPKSQGSPLSVTFKEDLPTEKTVSSIPSQMDPSYDSAKDFFSQPIAEPTAPTTTQQGSRMTKIIAILAVIVFIVTAGAGGYYYFFIQTPATPEAQIAEQEQEEFKETPEEPFEPTPVAPPPTTNNLPNVLTSAQSITVSSTGLIDALKTVAANMKTQSTLDKGVTYRPNNMQDLSLDPNEILTGLSIQLPEIKDRLVSGWIFMMLNKDASSRPGLIFELSNTDQVQGIVQGLEPTLPERFKMLFLEGGAAAPAQAAFKHSARDERIRFFNYPSDPTKSIDWGIITVQGKSFLVFATSKETMELLSAELEATGM